MSAYGPALFVSRKDGADLSAVEQERVFELVREVCAGLKMTDGEGFPVEPSNYGYDEEEARSLGILLYSSFAYAGMPEEVWADVERGWEREGARVAARVEECAPGVYAFVTYGVED
ncbi:hypothetical protein LTV02_12360 [Nocardia yamanashiensis]|uniref:hypothetical protein n=1 Tax=Nocardia yamanashiensis TaxID=209247 RepID=UPI001E56B1A6|nr:hypothetical protein [Nocardia yamanashiensis]UGT44125.1 hypothetical protein LTV02_12360 [Nocardia yamanashiensis]